MKNNPFNKASADHGADRLGDSENGDSDSEAVRADRTLKVHIPDDSWRAVRLDTLGLSERIVGALAEIEVETIGEFSDYPKGHRGRNATQDAKGIGPAGTEAIDIALERFWGSRPGPQSVSVPVDDLNGQEPEGECHGNARKANDDSGARHE